MKKVFLCHSSKDKPKVRKIADYLKENGIYVWIDEAEIRIGDSLLKKISEGIIEIDYLFACISNNSINSEWVNKELEIAMNQEIQKKKVIVVPVLLEDCDIPSFLSSKLYADMRTKSSYKYGYSLMLRRLGVLEPPKQYKRIFTSRELTVIDFIESYSLLELNSDKLLLLQSISHEKDMFWFEAFLEFYNDTLLSVDTAPKEIFSTALKVLENNIRHADNEIIFRIKELINFPKLLESVDTTIISTVISIISALNYYNDEIFEIMHNIVCMNSNVDCRIEGVKYFCTIIKEEWYRPDSDILLFSQKVFDKVILSKNQFSEEEFLAILISNWTSDNNLEYILNIYSQSDVSTKKHIIEGFVECRYHAPIYDPKLKNQFYLLLKDILHWNDDRLISKFLAYSFSKRSDVFDYEEIYDVLSKQSDFVLEYFFDCLPSCVYLFTEAERDILIDKFVHLVKQSNNPRKKHMVERILFTFYDDDEINDIYIIYDGIHGLVKEWIGQND